MCAVAPRHLGKGAAARPRCIPPAHRFAGAPRPKSLRALWKPDQETALSWTIALGFRALDHDRCFGTGFDPAFAKGFGGQSMGRHRLSPWTPIDPACAAGTAPGVFGPWTATKAGGLGCALVKENGRQRQ